MGLLEIFEGLMYGFSVAVQPENLFAALLGALTGSLIGIIPGIGPLGAAAVMLPVTYTMGPTAGLIMVAGIYYGVMYGGSTTAVLLNIPGEAPSVAAGFDGYPMTKQGRAGPALGIIALGSFIAGTTAVLLVTLFTPSLSRVAIAFGPADFFALTAGGLLVLSKLMGGRTTSGLLPMAAGIMITTVGADQVSGANRFTFGELAMSDGVAIVAIAIGMFGLVELARMSGAIKGQPSIDRLRVRDLIPTKHDFRMSAPAWGRGGLIGFFFGLLPGPSSVLATMVAYRFEKSVSKHPERFGTGVPEGVAAPEAANNAAATSSLIPLLGLGVPFSATLALIIVALQAHGVTPGPLIIEQRPDVFWGVIASLYIGNVMLLIINVPMIGVWVSMLRVPYHYLIPLATALAITAAYADKQRMLEIYFAVAFGALGFVFKKYGFQLAPLLVGMILGPLIEKHLREGLMVSQGDPMYFISRPISQVIWGLAVTVFVVMGVRGFQQRRQQRRRSRQEVGEDVSP